MLGHHGSAVEKGGRPDSQQNGAELVGPGRFGHDTAALCRDGRSARKVPESLHAARPQNETPEQEARHLFLTQTTLT